MAKLRDLSIKIKLMYIFLVLLIFLLVSNNIILLKFLKNEMDHFIKNAKAELNFNKSYDLLKYKSLTSDSLLIFYELLDNQSELILTNQKFLKELDAGWAGVKKLSEFETFDDIKDIAYHFSGEETILIRGSYIKNLTLDEGVRPGIKSELEKVYKLNGFVKRLISYNGKIYYEIFKPVSAINGDKYLFYSLCELGMDFIQRVSKVTQRELSLYSGGNLVYSTVPVFAAQNTDKSRVFDEIFSGKSLYYEKVNTDAGNYEIVYFPIRNYIGEKIGMLGVTNSEYFFEKLLNKMDLSEKKFFVNMGFSLIIISLMVFFFGFLAITVLVSYMAKPLKSIGATVEEILNGNLDKKVKVESRDELGRLGDKINKMSTNLQLMEKVKNEFLAKNTQELLYPLNGIIEISESLGQEDFGRLNKLQKRNLKIISKSGKTLLAIVDKMMDFSSLRKDEKPLQFAPVNVSKVADEVILSLSHLIKNKDVVLVNNVPEKFPLVNADRKELYNILSNLVENAIKFTKNGSIMVSSGFKGDMAEISVEDTGVGIPNKDFKRIFKSFEQVGLSHDSELGGTGLGFGHNQRTC